MSQIVTKENCVPEENMILEIYQCCKDLWNISTITRYLACCAIIWLLCEPAMQRYLKELLMFLNIQNSIR